MTTLNVTSLLPVSHDKNVIVHTRKSSVSLLWTTKEYTEGLIHLKSINFSVSIDDIYKRVVFDNI